MEPSTSFTIGIILSPPPEAWVTCGRDAGLRTDLFGGSAGGELEAWVGQRSSPSSNSSLSSSSRTNKFHYLPILVNIVGKMRYNSYVANQQTVHISYQMNEEKVVAFLMTTTNLGLVIKQENQRFPPFQTGFH